MSNPDTLDIFPTAPNRHAIYKRKPILLMTARRPLFVSVAVLYLVMCLTSGAWGFTFGRNTVLTNPLSTPGATSSSGRLETKCHFWKQLTDLTTSAPAKDDVVSSTANSSSSSYPWKFEGRCVFVPSLVRVDKERIPDPDLFVLNVAGWTLGGTVVLEYDTSPVGYYREWVLLGGLAWYPRRTSENRSFMIGQYGSRLFVSKPKAENLCEKVWGLVAEGAQIEFDEEEKDGSRCVCLNQQDLDSAATNKRTSLKANGWKYAQKPGIISFKNLGLLWTPTIKAIWTCLLKLPANSDSDDVVLPLNRLRLAGSPRPARFDVSTNGSSSISFGIGLAVEDLVIEISPTIPDP